MNSSLTYEILLYLNSFYFGMFALFELGLILFKAINLQYPTGYVVSELILLFCLCFTEAFRIFLGQKGNLTERGFSIILSLVLTVPCIFGVLYFLLWQTYVLRLEVILCGIQLTLEGLEIIFALLCLVTFSRAGIY